ncbi:DUF4383 domain-containing protein [Candidatus Parcubacteria bacterium]|nr:DUF4383 domain-containing protein [Candidatus Parcubacteria bacterium]
MAKKLAVVFGIVFVLVGVLGFFSNPIVGTDGYFVTDTIHNVVHLLIGIVLLIGAGAGEGASALWLKIFGVVYLVLFVDGLIEGDMLLGFVKQNTHDTYFHLVLGIVLLIAGFTARKSSMMMDSNPSMTM